MTYSTQVLNVPVEHLLASAQERALSVGSGEINQHSMRGLAALQVGALGELVFMEYLDNLNVPYVDESLICKTHDIRVEAPSSLIDVKAKERKLGAPQEHWDCTISDYLINFQHVDFYAFISLRSNDTKSEDIARFVSADILGTISKQEFSEKSEYIPKGTIDWSNHFTSHKDQWNVKILDLRPPKTVKVAI